MKAVILCILSIFLGLCGCFAETTIANKSLGSREPNPARLTISGSKLMTPTGQAIQLRGFNWGHWGKAQPQDAADNYAQGANVVRIILRWWGLYGSPEINSRDDKSPGHIDPEHLAMLDSYIKWATDAGLWVVLAVDSDCGQNGLQDSSNQKFCDPENKYGAKGHNFWTDVSMRQKFIEVWKFVANRYKDTPRIAMYEVLPEPNPAGGSAADVTGFYKEVMRAILSVDSRTPFLIGPGKAYKIRNAEEAFIPDAEFSRKIIYTGNLFVFTQQDKKSNIRHLGERLQNLVDLRNRHQVPIFVQQTGIRTGLDPDYEYLNAVLGLLNQNEVPWTYWEYRDGSGGADSFGVYYYDWTEKKWVLKPKTLETIKKYFSPRM